MIVKLCKYLAVLMMVVFMSSCLKEKPLTIDVEKGWYTVKAEKKVASLTGISGHSDSYYIFPDNHVYVVGSGDMLGKELYVKVKYFGRSYFMPFSTLEFYAAKIEGNTQYLGESPFEFDNPKSYLLLVIIALFILFFFVDMPDLGYLAVYMALPASIIIYMNGTIMPLWMCYPSLVYMPMVIISFLIILVILALLVCSIKGNFLGVFTIFFNPIYALASLVTLGLNVLAVMSIIAGFVEEDLWLAMLCLIALVPPSWRYLGSFIDSKGREWDVYVD